MNNCLRCNKKLKGVYSFSNFCKNCNLLMPDKLTAYRLGENDAFDEIKNEESLVSDIIYNSKPSIQKMTKSLNLMLQVMQVDNQKLVQKYIHDFRIRVIRSTTIAILKEFDKYFELTCPHESYVCPKCIKDFISSMEKKCGVVIK